MEIDKVEVEDKVEIEVKEELEMGSLLPLSKNYNYYKGNLYNGYTNRNCSNRLF